MANDFLLDGEAAAAAHFSSDTERYSGDRLFDPIEYRYGEFETLVGNEMLPVACGAFNDDTDVEYILKLFGLASRQMYDEFRLLHDVLPVRLLCMYAFDVHDENDSCGFDVE